MIGIVGVEEADDSIDSESVEREEINEFQDDTSVLGNDGFGNDAKKSSDRNSNEKANQATECLVHTGGKKIS